MKPQKPRVPERSLRKALEAAEQKVAFGPLFFMQHLRGLVRDRCPDPAEGIPTVQLHLMDGSVLDLCHIIGISPNWIALAVHEDEHPERPSMLRTELVPYHMIARLSIRANSHEAAHRIGFNTGLEPELYQHLTTHPDLTPEEALKAVAGLSHEAPPAGAAAASAETKRTR